MSLSAMQSRGDSETEAEHVHDPKRQRPGCTSGNREVVRHRSKRPDEPNDDQRRQCHGRTAPPAKEQAEHDHTEAPVHTTRDRREQAPLGTRLQVDNLTRCWRRRVESLVELRCADSGGDVAHDVGQVHIDVDHADPRRSQSSVQGHGVDHDPFRCAARREDRAWVHVHPQPYASRWTRCVRAEQLGNNVAPTSWATAARVSLFSPATIEAPPWPLRTTVTSFRRHREAPSGRRDQRRHEAHRDQNHKSTAAARTRRREPAVFLRRSHRDHRGARSPLPAVLHIAHAPAAVHCHPPVDVAAIRPKNAELSTSASRRPRP